MKVYEITENVSYANKPHPLDSVEVWEKQTDKEKISARKDAKDTAEQTVGQLSPLSRVSINRINNIKKG